MILHPDWTAIGRAVCAAFRAIAGPTLPLPPSTRDVTMHDPERMAAEIEAFVIALNADQINAEDFAG